ncbi:MAG: hypothetical protein ABI224_10880 [Acetobacteraceae bacterium]
MRFITAAPVDTLDHLLTHMDRLRQQDRVRTSLRAVAVLEQLETALTHELELRLGPPCLHALDLERNPWWEGIGTVSGSFRDSVTPADDPDDLGSESGR